MFGAASSRRGLEWNLGGRPCPESVTRITFNADVAKYWDYMGRYV